MLSNTGGHAAAAALLVGHVPPPAGAQQRGRLGPRPPGGQSGCCALELVIPRECSDQPPVRQHPQQLGLAERERPLLQRGRPRLLPRHSRGCWRPPPHRGPRHQTCQGGSDLCLIKQSSETLCITIQRNIAWSEYATATAASVPASEGMFQEVGFIMS